MSEHTWLQLKEKLRDKKDDGKPSLAIGFEDGRRVTYEETVEFKRSALLPTKSFLN